jgi:hypothetical protein
MDGRTASRARSFCRLRNLFDETMKFPAGPWNFHSVPKANSARARYMTLFESFSLTVGLR